ncbi:MAG: hypothetical protein IBX50_04095 [Marinospirillum sp.]|uniref:hypothetical protein n=1 Tax=Marinospirillum sp. TaxID=2183934 RepID=UPI0019DCA21D|nr:hypothetical protein [Marinospirillum sp.]MBE0505887.1 hypothetical protein [Marinospirillum sp.]
MRLLAEFLTLLNRVAELLGFAVGEHNEKKHSQEHRKHQKKISDIEDNPSEFGRNHFNPEQKSKE